VSKKTRHGKRKFSSSINGRKERQRSLAVTGPKREITSIPVPVYVAEKVNSKVDVLVSSTTPDTDEHFYIKAELLKVGILTGIIFFIMIVLAFILQ
jgi:hypothetical protein